jgi:hypothetical protein
MYARGCSLLFAAVSKTFLDMNYMCSRRSLLKNMLTISQVLALTLVTLPLSVLHEPLCVLHEPLNEKRLASLCGLLGHLEHLDLVLLRSKLFSQFCVASF